MTTRFLHHYHPRMGKHYGHTCHIARMNPNHPFLRQGKILYYRPDSAYDSDNPLDESDFSHSSDNDSDHNTEDKPDNKITFVMSKINSQSPSSLRNSSSTSSNFLHDNLTSEDRTPTKLTTNGKPSTTIHILECKDDGTNHVILESRSSPTNITLKASKVIEEETVHTKLATPAVPMVMDIEDKKEPKLPRMDWNEYHRLATIHTFMDDLEYNYPSICTTGAIGKSLEGRDLKILKISNTDSSNACVWIDAGIHAREWIAPAVATYIANHIATNFNQLPNSVTNKDWYILPVMNPDGYEYTHTKDRMWRKNRAWHSGQCVGVDLNRNFRWKLAIATFTAAR